MKVVAVSHSCVTDVNQQLYVAMQTLPDVEVELIVPIEWKSEYTGEMMTPRLLPDVRFPVHFLPVGVPGHISLYYFKQLLSTDQASKISLHAGNCRSVKEILRNTRPDIVFVDEEPWSLSAAQVAGTCRHLKIPYVCYTKQNIFKRYPLPFRLLERRIYRSAAAIIALSEEVREVLRCKGFQGNCPLLAHACDLALFKPSDSTDLRARLGLHGLVIGYMGRFVPEKGLDSLVEAVGAVARQQSAQAVSLLLVGSGVEEAHLRELAAGAGIGERTVFAGVVPHREAGNYMNCMDLFVLPSLTTPRWKEQFGRVIVEALACGVPVVGSDSGQIPFLIADTEGGLVFHEGDASDLAVKLGSLVQDAVYRKAVGERGRAAVEARYTYPAIASELARILRDAMQSK